MLITDPVILSGAPPLIIKDPYPTSFHRGVYFKGLISRIDGSVAVVRLTQRHGGVPSTVLLILVISDRDVAELSILQTLKVL